MKGIHKERHTKTKDPSSQAKAKTVYIEMESSVHDSREQLSTEQDEKREKVSGRFFFIIIFLNAVIAIGTR